MSHLRTDWLCVATEGDTVDGRRLERQWLIDAAETYNPELYAALIWPEHNRDWGNYGEVLAARYEIGEDNLVRLYVQLTPNLNLVGANSYGQMIYFSVELSEDNWRGSGRVYLEGLGVTDSPASVGTTRLRFSRRKNNAGSGYYKCKITRSGKIKQEYKMKEWQKWFGLTPKKFADGEEDTPPDDDKIQVLANALNDLEGRVSAIETQLSQTQSDVEEVQEEVEVVKEVVDTAEFATLRDNLPKIIKNFSRLDSKITQMPTRKIGAPKGAQENSKKFKFL